MPEIVEIIDDAPVSYAAENASTNGNGAVSADNDRNDVSANNDGNEVSADNDGNEVSEETQILQLKEEGNKLFSSGNYSGAAKYYTKALKLCPERGGEKTVFYKNRAAAYLKLEQYQKALNDSNAALELCPSDVKALFRRCQAHENLQKYDEAFKDARAVQHLDPKNSAIQPVLQRLTIKLHEIAKEQASTVHKVKQMFDYLLSDATSDENRNQAANNLVVLSREKAGAELIMRENGVIKLLKVMKRDPQGEISLACVRIIGELFKGSVERTNIILEQIGIPFIIDNLSSQNEQYVNSVQYMIQSAINTLTGMDIKESKKPDKALYKANEKKVDTIMTSLVKSVSSRVMTAYGRDAILELIMKNIEYETALAWGMKLVEAGGIWNLMDVSSELEDVRHESSMNITGNTRTHVAVTLDRVYYCMDHDKAREIYRDKVMEFLNDKLRGPDFENKVRATVAVTALLQGPLDVGNYCLGKQGIVEMMLAMASSDNEIEQRAAAEAIIAGASKKDKCTSIVSMGTGILKNLFKSKNDGIKVRALVGLCKLGSVGGFDASIRPFAEGSNLKLTSACRKFLINPKKDKDIRKWAAEGLSYLTLDAEVKEDLIDDKVAIQALIDLAKVGDLSVVYGVVTTLVNLTNCYDNEEILPELKKLAQFAKQHVPEDHPLDAKEYVDQRVKFLTEQGVTVALVALSKTESKSSRELIARVFNAICEQQNLRGTVVQQGGTKALLAIALECTDKGKKLAAQALSRIGITIDPEVAFPGQRCAEVVRPLMTLLHPDCTGLQNFESLLALGNLAQVSPSVRNRIVQDGKFCRIEEYMYDDHYMLKRAAVQCVVNLMVSQDVVKMYEGENDRVKYLVLLCIDDDLDTAKAAAGALAMLTEVSKKACKKVFDANSWHEVLSKITANEDTDITHRGVVIVNNLMRASKFTAMKIVETDLLEIIMAITRPEVDNIPEKVKKLAQEALNKAEEWKLIKQAGDANDDSDSDD